MADSQKNEKNSRDGLALIVGGLFILALVFAAYNYFNTGRETEETVDTQEATSIVERIKEAIKPDDNSEAEEGDLNGNGASDSMENSSENLSTDEQDSNPAKTSNLSQWNANDYSQGDIEKGSYTVKSGDTLWEIAEAVYGNGTQWTQILNANSSNIGYLANGQQALIVPGQVLVLP